MALDTSALKTAIKAALNTGVSGDGTAALADRHSSIAIAIGDALEKWIKTATVTTSVTTSVTTTVSTTGTPAAQTGFGDGTGTGPDQKGTIS
jgi:hypothetical protein